MNLYISGLAEVAAIQEQQNITQTLGILEFDPRQRYMNFYQGKSTWIKVDDMELSEPSLVNPQAIPPALIHVERIVDFSNQLVDTDNLLVHCFAGISRSTAAALIICYHKLNDIEKAKELVFDARPQAAPNRLLCSIADAYFGTGRLIYDAANEMNLKNSYKDFWNAKGQDWLTGEPLKKNS